MNKVHKTQRITFLLFKLNLLQKELKDYLQINILIDIIFTMKSLSM